MRTFQFYKAQRTAEEVPDVRIVAVREIPDICGEVDPLATARSLYEEEGKRLAYALRRSLPGGTIDALLRELLLQRASLLRVPMPDGGSAKKTGEGSDG